MMLILYLKLMNLYFTFLACNFTLTLTFVLSINKSSLINSSNSRLYFLYTVDIINEMFSPLVYLIPLVLFNNKKELSCIPLGSPYSHALPTFLCSIGLKATLAG